jgi:hypothetical protein
MSTVKVLFDVSSLPSEEVHLVLLVDDVLLPALHALLSALETRVDMVNYSRILDEVVAPLVYVSALHWTPHLVFTHSRGFHKRLA